LREYHKSQQVCLSVLGASHELCGANSRGIGEVLRRMGRFGEAQTAIEKSLVSNRS
jgi:hypothetical protein